MSGRQPGRAFPSVPGGISLLQKESTFSFEQEHVIENVPLRRILSHLRPGHGDVGEQMLGRSMKNSREYQREEVCQMTNVAKRTRR